MRWRDRVRPRAWPPSPPNDRSARAVDGASRRLEATIMTGSRFLAAVFAAVVAVVGAPTAAGATTLTYHVRAGTTTSGSVSFSAITATGTLGSPTMTLTDSRDSTRVGC